MARSSGFVLTLFFSSLAVAASHPDWAGMRSGIKTALHIADPLPDVRAKSYGQFSPAPGVTADRVSYGTGYGLRVPAIVYHAAGATIVKHPALVIVNGHSGDKSSWYAYWAGILYSRAGAVVLTYDPIGEYERNSDRKSGTRQHDTELAPPASQSSEQDMGRRLGGLMVTDVMQAVSYLADRPDVDPKRIAVLGYSMGSFVSSVACAVDTRIHACVLAGGGDLDGAGGYWDSSTKMCQAIPYQSLAFLGERGPALYALSAKRGPTLVINGSNDGVVDIPHHGADWFEQLRKQTVAELGSSKDVFDLVFVPGGGHAPYFLTKTAALWLQDKLKFPEWTKKQIEAVPEMQIREWATKNKLDAVSLRQPKNEGNLMALGNDIPLVSFEQLQAVPDTLWQSQKEEYVYESWVERAQAASQ